MRVPVPTNKLVAFTLVGAVLTTLVAGGLAFPGALDRVGLSDVTGGSPTSTPSSDGGASVATTPAANPDFTPAVQTRYRTAEGDQGGATSAPAPTPTPVPAATPTPNPNFTPAVQTQAPSRGEHEEYEEDDD